MVVSKRSSRASSPTRAEARRSRFSRGVKDALTPDIRDDSRNLLFDSTVNDVKNPEIFVTYHDAQAYPEYLIKFSQTGAMGGHPSTGKRADPRYKNNALEGTGFE